MSTQSRIIDLNRKRAATSYTNLNNYLSEYKNEDDRTKMKSYLRKLPVLIKNNGLIAALCFIKGKSKNEENNKNQYYYIYSWLEDWLNDLYDDTKENIIENLLDSDKTNIYTKEALEISIWYKKHAEAMIDDKKII